MSDAGVPSLVLPGHDDDDNSATLAAAAAGATQGTDAGNDTGPAGDQLLDSLLSAMVAQQQQQQPQAPLSAAAMAAARRARPRFRSSASGGSGPASAADAAAGLPATLRGSHPGAALFDELGSQPTIVYDDPNGQERRRILDQLQVGGARGGLPGPASGHAHATVCQSCESCGRRVAG